MAYTKTNWTSSTPINTKNLNNIENGIEQNYKDIEATKHTHTNKSILDSITQDNIDNWNNSGSSDFSGSYNDLTDKPTVPTKVSELENDSNFATESYVNEKVASGGGGTGGSGGTSTDTTIFETTLEEAIKTIEISNLGLENDVDYELMVQGKASADSGVYIRLNINDSQNFKYMEGGYTYQNPTGHMGAYTHSSVYYQAENGFHIGLRVGANDSGIIRFRFKKITNDRVYGTWECISRMETNKPIYTKGFGTCEQDEIVDKIFLIVTGSNTWKVGTKLVIRKVG